MARRKSKGKPKGKSKGKSSRSRLVVILLAGGLIVALVKYSGVLNAKTIGEAKNGIAKKIDEVAPPQDSLNKSDRKELNDLINQVEKGK